MDIAPEDGGVEHQGEENEPHQLTFVEEAEELTGLVTKISSDDGQAVPDDYERLRSIVRP
eukprot:8742517-Pyramimonas_sp.AAC.2